MKKKNLVLLEFDNNTYTDNVIEHVIHENFPVRNTHRVPYLKDVFNLIFLYSSPFKLDLFVTAISTISVLLLALCNWLFFLITLSSPARILKLKYNGVVVGDAILSSFLRTGITSSHYQEGFPLHFHFFKLLCQLSVYDYLFRLLSRFYNHDDIIFHCPETTYFPECLRRLALKNKFKEVRWRGVKSKFLITSGSYYGYDLRLYRDYKSDLYKLLEDKNWISTGMSLLSEVTARQKRPPYMSGSDVDTSVQLDTSLLDDRPVAVIYMCSVADAQFVFGPDCYFDLHEWLITSIRLARKAGYSVILKPHPSFFNIGVLPGEQKYLKFISEYFSIPSFFIDASSDKEHKAASLVKTRFSDVYVCPHTVSSLALKDSLSRFICISHHGTCAFELASLGVPTIVSSASYFSIFPKNDLILVCHTLEDFNQFLEEHAMYGHSSIPSDLPCQVYSFFYFMNIIGREFFPTAALAKIYSEQNPDSLSNLSSILSRSMNSCLSDSEESILNSFKNFALECYKDPSIFRRLRI